MTAFQKTRLPSAIERPAGPQARTELKGSGSSGSGTKNTSRTIPHEQIAQRAYEIYRRRGYAGDPDDDWYEAERQLGAGY